MLLQTLYAVLSNKKQNAFVAWFSADKLDRYFV